ncbi:response regulator [Sphingobium sp. CR2-8]|uniref:response regulator n=1 Tax=Sphingobium sp. CR2-8 TaxID=1306534 RepID=UPI002DBE9427|nr:response regulator [Sphingobium sp. CR2-8]MEC3909042.1 response regulator [Sphingobium sp. CR2-8]
MPADDKQTVLVVEDDVLVRMHGVDILEDAGFTVLEAETADDAIMLLQGQQDVHLLFSDIDMPGSMNGLELAQLVRDRWPKVRLLLTSGHHHIAEEALPEHGRFVRKPWTRERLIATIQATLAAGA